jgi:glycosyltransferase involved in cell wall biosynthesis
MKLSIVMPAYNEQENITLVIGELCKVMQGIDSISSFEVIVVDDHSSDLTAEQVLALNNPNAR